MEELLKALSVLERYLDDGDIVELKVKALKEYREHLIHVETQSFNSEISRVFGDVFLDEFNKRVIGI
tara:strand:+ start:2820 stop:3020 length:201 start_codon:yes stop_codon:yes gene_type:complete